MADIINNEFVKELLSIALKDKKVFSILEQHLKDEYLPTEDYVRLWKSIRTEVKLSENRTLPTIARLAQLYRKEHYILDLISDIKEIKVENSTDSLRSLEEFIKQNMFVDYYNQIGNLYNKGRKESAYSLFNEKAKELIDFTLSTKRFDRVFDDIYERSMEKEISKIEGAKRIRIPSGFDELDSIIDGFETGEFVLIVGDSGTGKSFLGNHFGVNAARRGYDVFHAQAEGTKDQVMDRYNSCWTGTTYRDIKDNNIDEKKWKSIERVLKSHRGEIFVECYEKFGSKTIVDVRNSLRELKKTRDIKFVILDYLDLVDPGDGRKYSLSEERHRQQAVSRACKDIAVEENVVFVSFTQASSISPDDLNNPDFVITRYNLAEDKGKLRPVDYLFSINQTKEEKKNNTARLYSDKIREHAGGILIKFCQNLKYSRFYDRKKTLEKFFDVEE